MTGDEAGNLITAVSAVIAAATGIWSVWWQVHGKHDQFLVGLGAIAPTIEQETMLHVVNLSDHAIKLKDWGFIEPEGRFRSLPYANATDDLESEDVESRGSAQLVERNSAFEMGYVRKTRPMGAYAISVTQTRPRLYFGPDASYWQRLRIRLRLLVNPNYFS